MEYVITTFKGLEPVLAYELTRLGAQDIQLGVRAVTCYGDKALMYKANYLLRTALRVLIPLHQFTARDPEQLYKKVRNFAFSGYFSPDQSIAIDVTIHSEYFTHSRYVMHKVKDGIMDQMRQKFGSRPSINTTDPDFRIHVRINKDEVTILSDTSGESLHKRGYKRAIVDAPMNEILGAGIILLSGWDKKTLFIDPMAGSGTLAIEAAMIAAEVPAQIMRKSFQFEKWRNFDRHLWNSIKTKALEYVHTEDLPQIFASDKDYKAIEAMKENIAGLPIQNNITVSRFDFFNVKQENAFIVFNPPYDERLRLRDVITFYEDIGTHLKHKCAGSKAWIITSHFDGIKAIGLKPSKKYTLFNGPLECKLLGFELFLGKRKEVITPAENDG